MYMCYIYMRVYGFVHTRASHTARRCVARNTRRQPLRTDAAASSAPVVVGEPHTIFHADVLKGR